MDLLEVNSFKCGVSSVLNKDVKQYGKAFMFDNEEDTSWSSDQGTPQWITIQFENPQAIKEFVFQFQGGFVGNNATVILENDKGERMVEEAFYPEDINSLQHFKLKTPIEDQKVIKIRFLFGTSTDFFGRIIVYKLKIF